jgi:energy-coupling factor transport system permease protein
MPQFHNPLHPLSVLVYAGSLFVASLVFSHPFYLAVIGSSVLLYVFCVRGFRVLLRYLKMTAGLAVLFVVVNVVVCQSGQTVLWQSGRLPFFGMVVDLSLEEIGYNLNMCFRILLVASIFCLYLVIQDVDRTLSFFSRFAPHSVLTLILTNLLIPHLSSRLRNGREARLARGANLDHGSIWQRVHAHLPILKMALHISLESSFEMQEALFARGYASGPRSHFQWFRWGGRDSFTLASGFLTFCLVILSFVQHQGDFTFYPELAPPLQSVNFFTLSLLFFVPAVVPVMKES